MERGPLLLTILVLGLVVSVVDVGQVERASGTRASERGLEGQDPGRLCRHSSTVPMALNTDQMQPASSLFYRFCQAQFLSQASLPLQDL